MSALDIAPAERVGCHPEKPVHVVCLVCSPDLGLCGTPVAGTDWLPNDTTTTCAVCADVEDEPCPRCGA